MKKSQIIKKIINEKFESKAQQRFFYAMSDKDTKKGRKFKKWAKEFSDDTDFDELPEKVSEEKEEESVNPKMKKSELLEYINSKKQSLSEQRYRDDNVGYVIRGFTNRSDVTKVFKYLETLRGSGIVNMFGSSVFLTYTEDDLERFLYSQRLTPNDLDRKIGELEYDNDEGDYDNDEGDYDSDIENLEEKKKNIEKLLSLQQEVRDVLIRTAFKRLELDRKELSMKNVQGVFDRIHKDFFKMWVSILYS